VHQLVNKNFDNIKMHGTTVKIKFKLLLVSYCIRNFSFSLALGLLRQTNVPSDVGV